MNATNQNIVDFLSYYCRLKAAPKYSVLIKGPWGSGKSHLVRRFFEANNDVKMLYVSLYGVKEISDIEDAFFAQLHPALSSKGMKVTAALLSGIVKSTIKVDLGLLTDTRVGAEGKLPEIPLPKFLSDARGRVLVFDDLERTEMPIKKVLGYINSFVEHDDSKVILIANEEVILRDPEGAAYADTKEKQIGKSFEIQADLEDAFGEFAGSIEVDEIKQFYAVKRADIETIFQQSGTGNLRTLQRTMWDFERLTRAMEPAHRRNMAALSAVVGPFFALSFEIKANRVSQDDILQLGAANWGRILRKERGGESRDEVEARYPEVKFENSILGMQVLRDAMFKSAVDAAQIKDLMGRSSYFVSQADEPAWRTLWFAHSRTVEQGQEAIRVTDAQFKERKFILQGEMLHVFGLRLFLSRIGGIDEPIDEVVRQCKLYIDEQYTAKRLDPSTTMVDIVGRTTESYQGLVFRDGDTVEFRDLADYLHKTELRVMGDAYPVKVLELLSEMEKQPDLFFQRLCRTNRSENLYVEVPILTYVAPEIFVDRVMSLSPDARSTVLMTFAQRYNFMHSSPALVGELDWLAKVRDLLRKQAAALLPLPKYFLNGAIDRYIQQPLDAARHVAATSRDASVIG